MHELLVRPLWLDLCNPVVPSIDGHGNMNAFSASPFFSFSSRITSVIPAFARQTNSARIHSKDPQTMTKASCKSMVSETTGNVYGSSPAAWTSTDVEEGTYSVRTAGQSSVLPAR